MWRTSPSPQNCEDVTNVSTCSQRSPEKATGATCPSDTPSPKTQGYSEKCYFLAVYAASALAHSVLLCPLSHFHTHTHTHQPHLHTAISRYSLPHHKCVLCQCGRRSRGISRIPLVDATTLVSELSMLVTSAGHGESTGS